MPGGGIVQLQGSTLGQDILGMVAGFVGLQQNAERLAQNKMQMDLQRQRLDAESFFRNQEQLMQQGDQLFKEKLYTDSTELRGIQLRGARLELQEKEEMTSEERAALRAEDKEARRLERERITRMTTLTGLQIDGVIEAQRQAKLNFERESKSQDRIQNLQIPGTPENIRAIEGITSALKGLDRTESMDDNQRKALANMVLMGNVAPGLGPIANNLTDLSVAAVRQSKQLKEVTMTNLVDKWFEGQVDPSSMSETAHGFVQQEFDRRAEQDPSYKYLSNLWKEKFKPGPKEKAAGFAEQMAKQAWEAGDKARALFWLDKIPGQSRNPFIPDPKMDIFKELLEGSEGVIPKPSGTMKEGSRYGKYGNDY